MDIRILNEQEVLPALHLVWEVFCGGHGASIYTGRRGRIPEFYQI